MPNSVILERHPQLYLPDGDIVLRAIKSTPAVEDGAQHYQLFRVHKFLLKYHSAPFGHTFADANVGSDETYDGVPMAEMHGDRAEDLGLLLNYIYNPSELNFKRFDPDTPVVLGGVIRIADKYLIEPLRDRLIKQVPTDWPTTLQEWDRFDAEISAIQKGDKTVCDLIPEPVSAILFAQEFDCPRMLPAAFYQLSRINYAHVWQNADRPRLAKVPVARWSLLDKDNLVRCMHGFQKLDDYRLHVLHLLSPECCPQEAWFYQEEYEAVKANSSCFAFLNQLILVVWDKRRSECQRDPLRLLSDCLDYLQFPELSREHFPNGLCDHCVKSFRETIPEERRKLWGELPKYFRLN
ncbi:hypothetical protein C8T65DRAFT_712639 [Cerioporus squamosus]|nr:hypothetical protein C8T65DRAFT_712639 [Cerioporus squamosus]